MNKYIKLLVVPILALALPACKKHKDDPPSYYFRANVNGIAYTGGENTSCQRNSILAKLHVTGWVPYDGTSVAFEVQLVNSYNGIGTYSDSNARFLFHAKGDNYISLPSDPISVKIVADDGNVIAGEFSGNIYLTDDSTKTWKVTDGAFYLQAH